MAHDGNHYDDAMSFVFMKEEEGFNLLFENSAMICCIFISQESRDKTEFRIIIERHNLYHLQVVRNRRGGFKVRNNLATAEHQIIVHGSIEKDKVGTAFRTLVHRYHDTTAG